MSPRLPSEPGPCAPVVGRSRRARVFLTAAAAAGALMSREGWAWAQSATDPSSTTPTAVTQPDSASENGETGRRWCRAHGECPSTCDLGDGVCPTDGVSREIDFSYAWGDVLADAGFCCLIEWGGALVLCRGRGDAPVTEFAECASVESARRVGGVAVRDDNDEVREIQPLRVTESSSLGAAYAEASYETVRPALRDVFASIGGVPGPSMKRAAYSGPICLAPPLALPNAAPLQWLSPQ